MKWIIRGGLALVLGLIVLAVGASAYLIERFHASKPVENGTIEVEGLTGNAQIVRDQYGIAHVFGDTDEDVYFAMGYTHASERFFQMDGLRRFATGRLSELIGADAIRIDAQNRTRGYAIAAEDILANISNPEVIAAIEAYTAGVNARLSEGSVAPEYALLRVEPEPWTPLDSASINIGFAYTLAAGERRDTDRARLDDVLSSAQLEEFMTGFPDWVPTTLKDEDVRSAFDEIDVQRLAPPPGAQPNNLPGSNAWIVSGARSQTGRPILANDPHLGLSTPSIWYYARLNLSFGPVIGATAPGSPLVILGRNAYGAWGYTNTGFDVIDLVERDANIPTTSREEVIKVKGGAPVTITVRETEEGPVLDPDWFDLIAFDPDQLVVLRSTINQSGNKGGEAAYNIMKSTGFDSFVEATRGMTVPMQNMHYAAVDGTIGYTTSGLLPIRDEDTGDWVGFVPFEELPRVSNPRDGIIASGNNLVAGDSYPYPLPGRYAVYRAPRIEDELNALDRHDLDSFKTLQLDVVSTQIQRIMPSLLGSEPETQLGAEALALLENWNGSLDTDSPEALIVSAWLRVLAPAIWADELGVLADEYNQPRRAFIELVLNGEASHWCDDIRTDGVESCAITAGLALDAAMEETARAYGRNLNDWRWGEAHNAVFNHPLQVLPFIGDMFTNSVPVPGDGSTVNVAHFSYSSGNYDAVHAASMRAIYDLADLNRSLYMFAPGQSGHPLSDHHGDLADPWARGEYFEIRDDWDPNSAPEGSRVLTLTPASD
jgi:penicillin amidase